MPVTLAQAALTATDDVDVAIIDEFRKSSFLLDALTFDDVVNPAGGGATLTYGYTRQITERAADFRAINAEYTPTEATLQRFTTDLRPLGGSFQIDRVLAQVGPGRLGAEIAFQMGELVKATRTFFADQAINGDTGADADAFDGLDVALTGSSTEYLPLDNGVAAGYIDLTAMDTQAEALAFLQHVDAMIGLLDAPPDVLFANQKLRAMFTRAAAWAGLRNTAQDAFGRAITTYGDIPIIDLGAKSGSSNPIVPIVTRDADEGGAGGNITGLTDLYAVRFGLDAFHAVSTTGPLVRTWLPDFTTAGAVKTGEAELGPAAVVLKASKAAGVLRNLKVQ